MVKSYAWWLLLLHQKEGSELDIFISDAVLGGSWTKVSHKCHWAFCFVVSHLEPVMRIENSDRTVCKNRSRGNDGGCNALHSLHPYDHCLLDMPVGTPFDIELPPPLPGLANGQKVGRSADKELSPPLSEFKHDIRGKKSRGIEQLPPLPERNDSNKQAVPPRARLIGPCVYGHTTSSGDSWLRDPADKTRVVCKFCWRKLRSTVPKRQRREGPCVVCHTITTSQWCTDDRGTVCRSCSDKLRRRVRTAAAAARKPPG